MPRSEAYRRWPTPEAFYTERDDRTNRVAEASRAYWMRPVEVVLPRKFCDSITGQRIALVVANLAAKWSRRVHVRVPPSVALARELTTSNGTSFAERAVTEMNRSDPFGTFTASHLVLEGDDVLRCAVTPRPSDLVVGESIAVTAWATGWRAILVDPASSIKEPYRAATRAAAGLAAALAVGQLFKRAIGQPESQWLTPMVWNMWSHQLSPDVAPGEPKESGDYTLDLGRTLLAGVGAIGSGFAYLASLGPMCGTLGLLDGDGVDVTNLNRSPIFTIDQALEETAKVDAVACFLEPAGITLHRYRGWWDDLLSVVQTEPWDVWISLTNERGVWSELPFHQPPLLLHATTTSGWGFGVGRHGIGDDCTRCRMPREHHQFRGPCAVGAIGASGEGSESPRAALPFLSVAAAAILLAEFERMRCGGDWANAPNQLSADLLIGLAPPIAVLRSRTVGCQGCAFLEDVQ